MSVEQRTIDPMRDDAEDAARYRWLRDHHRSGPQHRLEWYLPRNYKLDAEGLDAAIDEARKSE